MKNSSISLGQKVKSARLEKNLTQQDVVGSFITRNMLSKIENDTATPSIKTINYLAQKLDKPISYFVDDSELTISKEENMGLGLVFEHSCFLIKNMEFMKCIDYIENIMQKHDYSNTTYYHGPVLYNLIVCYMHLKNYNKVNIIYPEAIKFLELSGDYYYLSMLHIELNTMYLYNKEFKYCEELLKKALHYLEKSFVNNVALKIDLYYKLGYILMLQNKFLKAKEYFTISLDLSKQNNLFYNSTNIHLKLSIVCRNISNSNDSLYHIKKALILLAYTDDKLQQISALKQICLLYISIGDFNSAIVNLLKCLKYYSKDSLPANNLRCAIMLCLLNKGLYEKVITFSRQIDLKNVDIFWKNIYSYSLTLANIKLGNLEILKNDLGEITDFLEITSSRLSKSFHLKSLYESYSLISKIHLEQTNNKLT